MEIGDSSQQFSMQKHQIHTHKGGINFAQHVSPTIFFRDFMDMFLWMKYEFYKPHLNRYRPDRNNWNPDLDQDGDN